MMFRTALAGRLTLRAKVAVVAVALVLAGGAPYCVAQSTSGNAIDQVLRDATEKHKLPGIVVLVANAGGVTYQGAAGMRDAKQNLPMTLDSIFAIASMTKPVTSVAVMQLVERGLVKLDAPASTYLPELAKLQVLEGFDDAGKPKLRPAKSVPTVRQLLSHTAGFGYEYFHPLLKQYAAMGGMPSAGRGDDGFLQAPLLFDPGTRFAYGINTDWLGRLVEKVSGQSLEIYFREHIFKPLDMHDTFFNVPAEKHSRLVALHVRQGDAFVQAPPQPLKPVEFFSGGGGLYSTPADYMKFARMLLGGGKLGGKQILRPATVAEMSRNQIGGIAMPEFRSLAPQLAKDPIRIPGSMDRFGLGFGITSPAVEGGRAAGSFGWAGIFNTYFWIDPQRKTCAVIMFQLLPFSDDAALSVVEQFERAVYADAGKASRKPAN
jgi:CubicO group peptidase (beta-lactamase class C family)